MWSPGNFIQELCMFIVIFFLLIIKIPSDTHLLFIKFQYFRAFIQYKNSQCLHI